MPRSSSSERRKSCNRGHWRPAEDERLRQLVEQYGPQNWNFIAEHLEGRSGKSCRLRWYNQLDPNIVKRPFTEEEEETLLALHKVKGNKWAAISRFLPGRTDNAVKNHFHVLMARRKRERFTLFVDSSTNPNSGINYNFKFQNNRNMGIFGMSSSQSLTPWSHSGGSTITTELVSLDTCGVASKAHNDSTSASSAAEKPNGLDHFACYRAGSCMLSSYNSFTAPGIPSIGKVVPLPYRFSNANNGQRSEAYSIIKSKTVKHPAADNSLEEQVEALNEKSVSFIDFLGVGSCSRSHRGP